MATFIAILKQAANLGAGVGWLAELRCVVRAAPGGCVPLAAAGWGLARDRVATWSVVRRM